MANNQISKRSDLTGANTVMSAGRHTSR